MLEKIGNRISNIIQMAFIAIESDSGTGELLAASARERHVRSILIVTNYALHTCLFCQPLAQ